MADTSKESIACGSVELIRRFVVAMCEKGGTALLKAIKSAGVDVNIPDHNGSTLLMFAVYYAARCKDTVRPKLIEAICCLLRNGANANLTDVFGRTALSLAIDSQQKDIVQLLFKAGANFPSRIN